MKKQLVTKQKEIGPLKQENGNASWDAFCDSEAAIGPVELNKSHIWDAIENAEEHWAENYGSGLRALICDFNEYGRFDEIKPRELVDDFCRWWATTDKGRRLEDDYCLCMPASTYEWSLLQVANEFGVMDAFGVRLNTSCFPVSKAGRQS